MPVFLQTILALLGFMYTSTYLALIMKWYLSSSEKTKEGVYTVMHFLMLLILTMLFMDPLFSLMKDDELLLWLVLIYWLYTVLKIMFLMMAEFIERWYK